MTNLFELNKNFKITSFHLENGENPRKKLADAADFKIQCPAFGTVLFCIETIWALDFKIQLVGERAGDCCGRGVGLFAVKTLDFESSVKVKLLRN